MPTSCCRRRPRSSATIWAVHRAIGSSSRCTRHRTLGKARSDFDIFLDLSRRLGCEESFAEGRDEAGWLRHIYATIYERAQSNLVPDFDTFG